MPTVEFKLLKDLRLVTIPVTSCLMVLAKLVIGTVYILFGMAILGMCMNLMQEQIVVQVRSMLRRLGLIRPTRLDDQE